MFARNYVEIKYIITKTIKFYLHALYEEHNYCLIE